MNQSKSWKDFLSLIKSELSQQAYQTWFESIDLLSLEEEQITIAVPNRFHFEWLDSKYKPLIEQALKKAYQKKLHIKYSIVIGASDDSLAPNSQTREPEKLIPKQYHHASQLNNRYIFQNFVEGRGNQFAKAAASSVADSPGQTPFNPLLIYSKPGLGKTHLLQAIGNHILKSNKKARVVYVTSEKFMLDFISSIQNNKSTNFAKSYRDNDVLLLDDVQFFQTKEQTQEQFFHLFNDLFQQGKQIVLTTDRHPNELTQLKQRLVSRFQSGLIVDIQPPDLETRIAILMNKAKNENLDIPYDVTEFIAASIKEDIRAMEGALVKLLALASLKKEDITVELSRQVIEDLLGQEALSQISLNQISRVVAKEFGLNEKKIIGKSRKMELVNARHVAMFLCRELTSCSLNSIGLFFGKRDHSTVIHACKTTEDRIAADSGVANTISNLKNQLL
ncbi:chromosomal replication initiator protein DnaA [bacterium]|nr:chromosomal replication initiator protein DnaA [bacterium]|tara:strand:+ start:313 stop:1656 length:1344 start_codon:yes stop_codon:yes gene_type:complete